MKHLLILLVSVSLFWSCCKEEIIINCDDERSEFIYDGAIDQDSLLWESLDSFRLTGANNDLEVVSIYGYQEFGDTQTTYIVTELLTLSVPKVEGLIEPIQNSKVRYSHVLDGDAGGTDYIIDTLQENMIEVVCIDTIEQRICVSFDLHFIQDEESRYPWPEKVSFTEGLFCGSYAN